MAKTALITGAALRVGAAIAKRMHNDGYNVVIHYGRSEHDAVLLAESLNAARPHSAHTIQGDLADHKTAHALADDCVAHFGAIDLLVNNASVFEATDAAKATPEQWHAHMDINLMAPYFLAQQCAPHLAARRGSIVNIIDIYARYPRAGYAIYCASKAGLEGLTKSLAVDLAPEIRVNGVSPGAILWSKHDDQAVKDETIATTPLRRIGDPSDIADTVSYFANAPFVTGQIVAVDGGRTLEV